MAQVNVSNLEGTSTTLNFTGIPDECPLCNRGTSPRVVVGVVIGAPNGSNTKLRITFQCTWHSCLETFFGYYDNDTPHGEYALSGVAPKRPRRNVFPDSVAKVSPNFVLIYTQAIAAESQSLDQIAGIGLRKALEFLMKDFLIHEEPIKAEEIKAKLLGKCIDDYVTDPNIKATAKLATWLGNDETHYVRKWEDKDINDLKVLIRLTTNWVDSVLLTQKYAKDMNP
jgi:hypothetical protein